MAWNIYSMDIEYITNYKLNSFESIFTSFEFLGASFFVIVICHMKICYSILYKQGSMVCRKFSSKCCNPIMYTCHFQLHSIERTLYNNHTLILSKTIFRSIEIKQYRSRQ